MKLRVTTYLSLGAVGLLSACNQSAYYPLHPTVPLVSDAQPTEVKAGVDQHGFGYVSASAAPVNHLLLTSTVSGRLWGPTQFRDQRHDERKQHQWELGVGTFTRLSPNTTIGLLGGYGRGRSEYQHYQPDLLGSFLSSSIRPEYRRYETANSRWYGQAYIVSDLAPRDAAVQLSLGAAYRLSLVQYRRFSAQQYVYYPNSAPLEGEVVASQVPNVLWHSLSGTAVMRLKRLPAVGLQTSVGLSLPQRASQAGNASQGDYTREVNGRGNWGQASVGVTLNPHYLLRGKGK